MLGPGTNNSPYVVTIQACQLSSWEAGTDRQTIATDCIVSLCGSHLQRGHEHQCLAPILVLPVIIHHEVYISMLISNYALLVFCTIQNEYRTVKVLIWSYSRDWLLGNSHCIGELICGSQRQRGVQYQMLLIDWFIHLSIPFPCLISMRLTLSTPEFLNMKCWKFNQD